MKCVDLSEVKMIIKQNIIPKNVDSFNLQGTPTTFYDLLYTWL